MTAPGDDGTDPAFAARMLLGLVEAGVVEGKPVTRREVARRAAAYLGLSRPVPERTVGRYFEGRVPRDSLKVIEALAHALHVDPGWLAFGEKSRAPIPRAARTAGWGVDSSSA